MTELPPGWAESALSEICERVAKHNPADRPDDAIRYIDIGGIQGQRIVETREFLGREAPSRARQLVRSGDTVLSTVRTYLRKTALVLPELDEATASTGFCVLRPAPGIEPAFIFYRVIEFAFVAALSELQTGSSYPAVRDADVIGRRVLVPPTNEQRRIVAAIEEHLSRLDVAEGSLRGGLQRLTSLRGNSVDQLLNGAWPWTTTGEIAAVQGGIQKQPKRQPTTNKAPFLRVANVLRGRLDLTSVHEIEVFDGDMERYEVRPGDLLVVEGNGSNEQIGRSALWRGEIEGCVHQNHLIRVRPGPALLPAFLNIYWNASTTRRLLSQVASSTSGLYTLSTSKVKAVPIPVVPLAEQRHIVAEVERQLSLIDALTSEVDASLQRSKSLRRSILERAFAGKLVPQDPADEPASVLLERIAAERAAAPRPIRRRKSTA